MFPFQESIAPSGGADDEKAMPSSAFRAFPAVGRRAIPQRHLFVRM